MAEMETKIIIDRLTNESVNVIWQQYIIVDGEAYKVGDNERGSFLNSEIDRVRLQEKVQEPYLSAIFAVWGDETVDTN